MPNKNHKTLNTLDNNLTDKGIYKELTAIIHKKLLYNFNKDYHNIYFSNKNIYITKSNKKFINQIEN